MHELPAKFRVYSLTCSYIDINIVRIMVYEAEKIAKSSEKECFYLWLPRLIMMIVILLEETFYKWFVLYCVK